MKDYKTIFENIESTLISIASAHLPVETVRSRLDDYKHIEGKTFSDNECYRTLVEVIFYSGFRAETVDAKLKVIYQHFPDYQTVARYDADKINDILNDPQMIRNKPKIEACVENARVMQRIVEEHGSFQAYIDSFQPRVSFENLTSLKEELEHSFKWLGPITTYHFLTDIGLPVLKPDRVICRIFRRLGLIAHENQLVEAIMEGHKFAQATGHPIRYIDIVFVVYGTVQSKYFGIEKGICLEKSPQCTLCGVRQYCNYFVQKGSQ